MSIVLNRTRETTSSTGTGNLTLTGAVSGHQTFNSAIGTDRYFYYWIEDGSAWETGIGHLSASTTFVRDTLIDSSTGSKLSVTTAAEIYSEAPGAGQAPIIPYVEGTNQGIIPPGNWVNSLSTVVMTADRVYYIPYQLLTAASVVSLHCRMSAAAGTKFRMGIYQVGSDGDPQELIQETGDLTPSATGFNSTFSAIDLPAGFYYASIVADGGCTVYCYNNVADYITGPLGAQNSTTLGSYPNCLAYESSASWTTMPATAAPTTRTAAKAPRILMGV